VRMRHLIQSAGAATNRGNRAKRLGSALADCVSDVLRFDNGAGSLQAWLFLTSARYRHRGGRGTVGHVSPTVYQDRVDRYFLRLVPMRGSWRIANVWSDPC
jgi:hypothetical protein